jgi:Zn-dependent protease
MSAHEPERNREFDTAMGSGEPRIVEGFDQRSQLPQSEPLSQQSPFDRQAHQSQEQHGFASAPEKKGKAGGMLGGLGILGIILLKGKFYIFAALKALSFLKLGWLFKSFFMFFASIAVYWAFFGPIFAVIVVGMILIHELGHYVWMKVNGLNPKPIMFIPGLGAFVEMEKMPADQATDAWVALAGPLVGGVAAAGFYYFGVTTQNLLLMAAGSVGIFLNLLQLIPAKPLDGGFVINAINKWLLIPGVGLAFAYAFFFHSFLFGIIAVIAFFNVFSQFKNPDQRPMRGGQLQVPATMQQRVMIAIAYFGLAGMLGYLYWLSHEETINMLPSKHKTSVMKYHRDTPDHESFTHEEEAEQ